MVSDWHPNGILYTRVAEFEECFDRSQEVLSFVCCSFYPFTHIPASTTGRLHGGSQGVAAKQGNV